MYQSIERHHPLLLIAGTVLLSGGFVWFSTLGLVPLRSDVVVTEAPCLESEFTCYTFEAPVDHDGPGNGETIPVTFAVRPADGISQGVFVTASGRRGAPAVAYADYSYPYLGEDIADSYDIVYFDQRGIEIADLISCPEADLDYSDSYVELPGDSARKWDQLSTITTEYVDRCLGEMARPDLLPYLTTDQAAADLEMFRDHMGYEDLIIYGESYGTQLAQVYATRYPDSVERLILDGTVDTTTDRLQSITAQMGALDGELEALFEVCELDEWCSYDTGSEPSEVYDELVAALQGTPVTVSFPVDKTTTEEVSIAADDLNYLAFLTSYTGDDRMLFLRALGSHATFDDLIPMVRLFSLSTGGDLVNSVYYTVSCSDTPLPGNDLATETAGIDAAHAGARPEQRWFYEGELACLHWPGVDRERTAPQPFVGAGIPTLVVGSTLDVATPYSQALSVLKHLDDGYLLTVDGGSHVMFGREIPCVDDVVVDFVIDGTAPRTSECTVDAISPYVTVLPESLDDLTPAELLSWVEPEVYWLPEYVAWDWYEPMTLGCAGGGEIRFSAAGWQVDYDLDRCALADGLTVTGTGRFDYDLGVSRLDVALVGHPCRYEYELTWEDMTEDVGEVCT